MKPATHVALLCTALGALAPHPADAAILYASSAAGAPGELFTLDPATGAVLQDIGPLNDAAGQNYPITGLAFQPATGTLYASTGNANPASAAKLVTIDPATARVTVVGDFNAGNAGAKPATMADLSFDPLSSTLYGIGSPGGPQLYSIDPASGQATLVGDTGLTSTSGGGLAFRSDGTPFATPTSSRFGTYDLATGAFTNLANPVKPLGGAYAALSFDDAGTLFALNSGSGTPVPTHLVTIDPASGAVTDLGPSADSLDAIAFLVPEPTTLTLLLTPATLLLTSPRRRRRK